MTNLINSVPATAGDSVPLAIASWLACLAIVLVIGLLIVKVAREVRGRPMAGEVRSEALERYTQKAEFAEHVEWNRREHENLYSKIGGVERGSIARMDDISKEWRQFVEAGMRDLVASNNTGREKLHDRINQILREVGEIRGELKGANKR